MVRDRSGWAVAGVGIVALVVGAFAALAVAWYAR
jgi:hypothetical protein